VANLIIVSNRLPVKIEKSDNNFKYNMSTGGLATGLKSFYKNYNGCWIGWPGLPTNMITEHKRQIKETLNSKYNCEPVFLDQNEIDNYYLGYSNKTMWPLCHYFTQYVSCNPRYWQVYKKVNEKFAEKVSQIAKEGDIIWVHDYHLMLLPKLLRQKLQNVRIGYFHHIPFPSYEIFRLLPKRKEILEGLLGADLIGFHTYDYLRHFQSSIQRLLGYKSNFGKIELEERVTKVDSFPMGIDFTKFSQASEQENVQEITRTLKNKLADHKVVLSIDRMDYTKGIIQRLQAYRLFLRKYTKYIGKLKFIVVTVPSREEVEQYHQLKNSIERLVSEINGEYGILGWMPIWYLHKAFDFENLVALYNVSDIYVVTPLRDGMNLMAKEYLAARNDKKGILILSEMAGASKELGETITVNPNNIEELVKSIQKAVEAPETERIRRNAIMRERLERYNVKRWAEDFFHKLNHMQQLQKMRHANILTPKRQEKIVADLCKSKRRLLLIDYDDTLMPYTKNTEEMQPTNKIITVLKEFHADKQSKIVVLSQADKHTMQKWFGDLQIDLVAARGETVKVSGKWEKSDIFENDWKEDLRSIFQLFVDRTPGSFFNEKKYSLIWDYSKAAFDLGEMRARELVNELTGVTANMQLQIMEYGKKVELRSGGLSKEHASLKWLTAEKWDFVLVISGGFTGDRMFEHLPTNSYTINIGKPENRTDYFVKEHKDIVKFMEKLSRSIYED
jgi:trehalose 6-phosphate synthase/phosphatase